MYLSVSGLFITVALSYTGGLQGTGDTRSPLYISIISQVIVPLGLCTLLQALYGLEAVHIWTAIVIGHATRATLSVMRFKQGKWRGIAVDIEPAQTLVVFVLHRNGRHVCCRRESRYGGRTALRRRRRPLDARVAPVDGVSAQPR